MKSSSIIPFLALVSAAASAASPATCTSTSETPLQIDTRNLSEIYAAAQQEQGILQVAYGGDEKTQANNLAAAFSTAFPNVTVNFTVDLSKYHEGRINRAYLAGGGLYADVAVLQTLHDFDVWKYQGRLLNYKPPGFNQLWTALTDANGAYLPVFAASFGPFVFNTSLVSQADAPQSYADVLLPKWKGKMVLTYPNDDDAVLYLFALIVQQYGWSWLDALIQQDVQWVRGTATPVEVLARGSNRTLSFTTFPLGPGWAYAPPVSDRYMSWAQTSAIFAATKMPETARLLQAFLVSEQWQSAAVQRGSPSVRKDVGNGDATIWNRENTDYVKFHEFMLRRDVVEAWRFQFEDKLGTAQGLSPLIDAIQ